MPPFTSRGGGHNYGNDCTLYWDHWYHNWVWAALVAWKGRPRPKQLSPLLMGRTFKDNHEIFQMIVIVCNSWKKPLSHDRGRLQLNVSVLLPSSSHLVAFAAALAVIAIVSIGFFTSNLHYKIQILEDQLRSKIGESLFLWGGYWNRSVCLSIMIFLAKIWPTARTFRNYDDADSFSQSLPQAGKTDPGVNIKLSCLENQF